MKRFNQTTVFISLMILFIVVSFTLPVWSTTCKCRQHSAKAEAGGTCSRTEDRSMCTLAFSATTEAEYRDLVRRLNRHNINVSPHDALDFAWENPPERWRENDIGKYLAPLFIISMKHGFSNISDELLKTIANESQKWSSDIKAFSNTNYQRRSVNSRIGSFDATISYGCIELRKGDFYSMVKTRYSLANNYCDDF